MSRIGIAGYKFIALTELAQLRDELRALCERSKLKGTILLSAEGININLAGEISAVNDFQNELKKYFADIAFHVTRATAKPFEKLKIKLKKEIITFKQSNIEPVKTKAPSVSPETLKQWLDEKKPLTLLDTRNQYEIQLGSFSQALDLQLNHFSEFPNVIEKISHDKPIVMFCTGGIRCEKAALYLLENGFQEVYQLEGGILGYFAKVGKEHFNGECFVFDNRIQIESV